MEHIDAPRQQMTNYVEKEPRRDESEQACFMVQENDSLEVYSDTHLDDCASSSDDHDSIDAHALNESFPYFVKTC